MPPRPGIHAKVDRTFILSFYAFRLGASRARARHLRALSDQSETGPATEDKKNRRSRQDHAAGNGGVKVAPVIAFRCKPAQRARGELHRRWEHPYSLVIAPAKRPEAAPNKAPITIETATRMKGFSKP